MEPGHFLAYAGPHFKSMPAVLALIVICWHVLTPPSSDWIAGDFVPLAAPASTPLSWPTSLLRVHLAALQARSGGQPSEIKAQELAEPHVDLGQKGLGLLLCLLVGHDDRAVPCL